MAVAFIRRDVPKWAHAVAPALFAVAYAIALPARDTRDQLRMERAVVDGRFADVLEVAPKKAKPERMETAWRILAMFRLDTLDRDLNRYPICGSHLNTEEEEMVMEGPLMYFNYGMILTARRLKALDADPIPNGAFPDLADVSDLHHVWQDFEAASGGRLYILDDRIVERAVYSQFLQLQNAPPPMIKMAFAAAILSGRPEFLRDNREAIKSLYPNGDVGAAFLEAMGK